MSSEPVTCPRCKTEHETHDTSVRTYSRFPGIRDFGYRCRSCKYEWGHELSTPENPEPTATAVALKLEGGVAIKSADGVQLIVRGHAK